MNRAIVAAALVGLVVAPMRAGGARLTGEYIEARTAEIFTGGCIMGSEAETVGKQAVLAWKIDRGSFNGVPLDGLAVVAAVAGDKNLGIQEIGGGRANVRSEVFVDARASRAHQLAIVAMASELSNGTVSNVVQVTAAPIEFADEGGIISVSTRQVELSVEKSMPHDPSCGAMQWFHAFVPSAQATMGVAIENAFSGSSLGTKWSDPNKRSAFFGTFTY
ncbi:MAG: DUF1326 domain-containing protein [Acidobacteria bacterium]|nr:DUF1326 domain-containing protein [Acidobacteriota bacterium]